MDDPHEENKEVIYMARFNVYLFLLKIAFTTIGLLLLFAALFPIMFIIVQSLYERPSIVIDLVQALDSLTLDNYFKAIQDPEFYKAVITSITISVITILLSVLFITPAAFAFSRFKFRGRDLLLSLFLVLTQAGGGFGVVAVIALIMFLQIISSYGIPLYGWHVLPFIYTAGLVPFQTWLLKSYFDNLPRELDEAAFIDGANWATIIFKVILPSSRPAIIIIVLFSFMAAWGEFFIANLMRVTTIGAYIFRTAFGERGLQNPSVYAALSILYALPIIIVYIVAQKYIGEAYRLGIVKG